MQVDIRHSPSYALGRLALAPGETINVEAGAMAMHSSGIQIESKMEGGLFNAAKRALLSGDSFFVSKFTAPQHGGWVDVAPVIPGDIVSVTLDPANPPLILTRGVWLASELGVQLDPKFGNAGSIFGGEGLFLVRAWGQGQIVLTAYGALDVHSLKAGEGFTVDTGHLVAYEESVRVSVRKAATGFLNTLKSGEGLVMDLQGPGDVITQSRNPAAFTSWIVSQVPSR